MIPVVMPPPLMHTPARMKPATLLALVLSGNLLATLIIAAVAAMIPMTVVNYLASRRRKAFVAQLPDTLQLLSGTLRAGYSLMQGVEAVSKEVDDPIAADGRRRVRDIMRRTLQTAELFAKVAGLGTSGSPHATLATIAEMEKLDVPRVDFRFDGGHDFSIDITKCRCVLGFVPEYDVFRIVDAAVAFRESGKTRSDAAYSG